MLQELQWRIDTDAPDGTSVEVFDGGGLLVQATRTTTAAAMQVVTDQVVEAITERELADAAENESAAGVVPPALGGRARSELASVSPVPGVPDHARAEGRQCAAFDPTAAAGETHDGQVRDSAVVIYERFRGNPPPLDSIVGAHAAVRRLGGQV